MQRSGSSQSDEGSIWSKRARAWISDDETLYGILTCISIIVIGVGFAFLLVGPRVINPFDTSWLIDDPADAYLGWKFFRSEAHLSFPIGWSSLIAYPFGEPIAWLDAIPLIAAIFWLARSVVPPDFQYLGLYFVLNSVLQLYFGYRICRRLVGNDRLSAMTGGLLFMIAPPFVWRAFGHFALSSHWLVLAALEIFLATTAPLSKMRVAGSAVLCFVAGGINPYLTFMVLLILGAAHLRGLLSVKEHTSPGLRFRRIAFSYFICVAISVAALTIFGFIRVGEWSGYFSPDYGVYSMNLLAPIDPMKYGALLFKPQPTVGNGQYEGYNYLGLGIILLVIIALARRPSAVGKLFTKDAVATWAIVGVSLLLALSMKATAGNLILYDLSRPHWLWTLLSAYRASGRFFWPTYYLVLLGAIAAACGVFEGRRLTAILLVVFLIQFADLRGLEAAVHAGWRNSSGSVFTDSPQWQELGRDHRHLVVIPPLECNREITPGGINGFWIFGKLAARQNMTTNDFYAGRTTPKQTEFFCNHEVSDLARDGLDAKTAYVFSRPSVLLLTLKLDGHFCRAADGVLLCSVVSGHEGLDPSALEMVPFTPTGELIPVTSADTRANSLFGYGWSSPESSGRWTERPLATFLLRIADRSKDALIELSVAAFAPYGHQQRVEVSANGTSLTNWTFVSSQPTDVSLRVPSALLRSDGLVILTFRIPDAIAPITLGFSRDARQLGINVTAIRVTQN